MLLSLLLLCLIGSVLIFFKFRWGADHLRFAISAEMSQRLGREVTVGHVSGNILTNVVLHDVSIARKGSLEEGALLSARKVVVHYRLPALLKRELTPVASVSTVEIDAPQVFVERSREGKLNLLELVKPRKPTPPENRFRGHILLREGRIDYLDHTLPSLAGQPLHLLLGAVEANASFTIRDRLQVSFRTSELSQRSDGALAETPNPQPSTLLGQISFDAAERTTALSLLASDLDLEALAPHIVARAFGSAPSGRAKALRYRRISGSATVQANLLIGTSPGPRVQGRASRLQSPEPEAQSPKPTVDYRLAFSTPHCVVSLPELPYPVHFSGSALLSPEMVFLEGMKVAGSGFVGTVTGEISDFSRPQLRLNIEADYLDFNRFRPYLPASLQPFALQFAAPASGSFAVWGDLRRPLATGQLALPALSFALPSPQRPRPTLGGSKISLQAVLAWPPGASPAVSAALVLRNPHARNLSMTLPVPGGLLPGRQPWWPTDLLTSGPVSVDLTWVQGRPAAQGSFDLRGSEWEIMGTPVPIEAKGKFAFGPKAFSLEEVAVITPLGEFEGRASFIPQKKDTRWSVVGEMNGVRLDRLATFLPPLERALGSRRLGGIWQADFTFNSTAKGKEAMLRGELSDFLYAPASKASGPRAESSQSPEVESPRRAIQLRKVSCLLKVDENTLDIGTLAVSDPALHLLVQGTLPLGIEGLTLLARGHSPPGLEGDCDLRLALDGADLAKLPLAPGLTGNAAGRIRLHGPASLPLVEAEIASEFGISTSASGVESRKASTPNHQVATGNSQPTTRNSEFEGMTALVKASGTTARIVLDKFTISGPLIRTQAEGEITGLYVAGKSHPRCDMRLNADTCDISRLVPPSPPDSRLPTGQGKQRGFPFAGHAHVELAISGPLLDPSAQGSASLRSGFLLGEEIEQAEAELAYQARRLAVPRFWVNSALLALEGSGEWEPGEHGGPLKVAFRLSEMSPGTLANSLGLPGRAFAGSVRGDGSVEGTISSPKVELALNAQEMRVGRTDFASFSAQLGYSNGSLSLKAHADGPQATVSLSGDGNLSTGGVNGVLDGTALDLEELSRTFVAVRPRGAPPVPALLSSLQGNADVNIKFGGSVFANPSAPGRAPGQTGQVKMKPPDLVVSLRAEPISLLKEKIGNLKVNASYAKNQLQIAELRAITGEQHLVASGFVNLPPSGGERKMSLMAMGSGLALDTLARFLPGGIPGEVTGNATEFRALVEGPLASPDIEGSLEVEKPAWSSSRTIYNAPSDIEGSLEVKKPSEHALAYDHLRIDVNLKAEKSPNVKANLKFEDPEWRDWLVQHPSGLNLRANFGSKDGRGGSVLGNLPFSWQPLGLHRDQEMSLVVAIDKDDLASVAGLVPRLTRAHAPIVMHMEVGGTLERMRVDGSVSLAGGQVSLAGLPSDIQALLCQLDFESRTEPGFGPVNKLTIRQLQGRFLGGAFQVSGAAERVVSFSPSQALKNDYNLTFASQGLDLSKLNPLLESPSVEEPGAVSFGLPPLKGEVEISVRKGKAGFTELYVKKVRAVGPKGTLLSCQGSVTLTQTDPSKFRENLFDLTLEIRKFETRVIPYFHGEINTKGPHHIFLKNPSSEPVRLEGDLEITKGVMTMAARKEPLAPPQPRLRPEEEPFWDARITPGRDFFILLPRFRQPMDGEITVTGTMLSPFIQGRLWARPGGRLVSLSEQWRTEKCDVDFWASVSHGEAGWSAQYNGTIDFKALGQVTYRGRTHDVAMMLNGPVQPPPIPSFEATPYLTQQEVFAALGHAEVVERIMAGENAREVLSREIFNIGEAEAARAILDPIGGELKKALGLEALSLEYGFDSPIRIRLTKDVVRGISLSYTTTVTAAREEYRVEGAYRLPERFSRGARPKTVGVTYDETRTVAGNLRWEWQF